MASEVDGVRVQVLKEEGCGERGGEGEKELEVLSAFQGAVGGHKRREAGEARSDQS